MIVTCPGCGSKYRVKNESVPAEGAKMKCPKCDTMFLAKPPTLTEAKQHLDEPSSQYQSINPQVPRTAPTPLAMPAAAPPPKPAAPAAGPVTALFGAFDASQLPPEMQRPPQPTANPHAPGPSGLDVDSAPKPLPKPPPPMHVIARPPTLSSQPAVSLSKDRSGPPSMGVEIGAWAAVGVGAFASVLGLLVFAWTSEMLNLDSMLLPVFAPFGATEIASGEDPTVDELRAQAKAAVERGDVGAGIVIHSRVRARDANDPFAKTEIPRLRSELGERQGS